MNGVSKEFRVPATMALLFGLLSVISTAATAVMPLVI
jgi:hypothetical protein